MIVCTTIARSPSAGTGLWLQVATRHRPQAIASAPLRETTFDLRSRRAGFTVYAGKSLCVRAASDPRSEWRLRRAAGRWFDRRACRRTSRTSQPRKPHRPGEEGGTATRGTIFAASTHPRASSWARLPLVGACALRVMSRFARVPAQAELARGDTHGSRPGSAEGSESGRQSGSRERIWTWSGVPCGLIKRGVSDPERTMSVRRRDRSCDAGKAPAASVQSA